jgi:hypothetical protein
MARSYDIQYNYIKHNDIRKDDTQHNAIQPSNEQNAKLRIITLSIVALVNLVPFVLSVTNKSVMLRITSQTLMLSVTSKTLMLSVTDKSVLLNFVVPDGSTILGYLLSCCL